MRNRRIEIRNSKFETRNFFGFRASDFVLSSVFLLFLLVPLVSHAAQPLTYRYLHHLFFLDPDEFSQWQHSTEEWIFEGSTIRIPASFRVDGDVLPALPMGVIRNIHPDWDRDAIRSTLAEHIAAQIDRDPGTVVITRNDQDDIVFGGIGMLGRRVNLDSAVALTIEAIEQGVTDIILPVEELQPQIAVEDKELRSLGIREVIALGESDFSRSPTARRHNIAVGLEQFNGALIDQGATFSFNEVLGPVNRSTGYLPELVILGDRTLPDYGGGLCQVSTTAFRGVWEYGFPIVKRRNHSFAVRYYSPQGTDATIYPPHTDVQFKNDSPGAILIQTHIDDDLAYYIYYGTDDGRHSEIIGPYIWGHKNPSEDRTEYTTELAPGETRQVQKRVPGLQAMWYRVVQRSGEDAEIESYHSFYEARSQLTQVGVVEGSSLLGEPEVSSM